jgi:hypothetical protein
VKGTDSEGNVGYWYKPIYPCDGAWTFVAVPGMCIHAPFLTRGAPPLTAPKTREYECVTFLGDCEVRIVLKDFYFKSSPTHVEIFWNDKKGNKRDKLQCDIHAVGMYALTQGTLCLPEEGDIFGILSD